MHKNWLCWVSSIHLPGTPAARGESAQGQPALPAGGDNGAVGEPHQGPGGERLHKINFSLTTFAADCDRNAKRVPGAA